MTKYELLEKASLPNQDINVKLNLYTVSVAVSEVDADNKLYRKIDVGTYNLVSTSGLNDNQKLGTLRKIYPELTKYRNLVVTNTDRKTLDYKITTEDLIKLEKEGK